ncbi:phosphatase PAP2 family protein [Cupriavidus gilardii]|uniref:phosphatase PAP2 family protein n=1 Tax=Cupriavidus sp. DB3 TaxID=2873259 RepID=UPI0011EBD436|nr:phosphatase PAP2 family protein [Cupriavidus sp. DB3]KAA0180452.1 phosphatase PAP2 family protein [Cupriavidus gilardii]MCA7083764.1 phosphatase PAP2 family protein [Cupriavidus sp. DB3]
MWHWHLISRFGDAALLLPCAALLLLSLCHRGEWRAARDWCLAFAAAAGLTLASKLAFIGWGIGVPALDFTGFSGHSMMAASVLPVLLHRLAPGRRPRLGWIAATLGASLALLVGYSRLPLGAHSLSEVVGGLALGFAVSGGYLLATAPRRRQRRPPRWRRSPRAPLLLLIGALLLGVPASGAHAPTEQWIEQIALYLSGRARPFQREDWQRREAATIAPPAPSTFPSTAPSSSPV